MCAPRPERACQSCPATNANICSDQQRHAVASALPPQVPILHWKRPRFERRSARSQDRQTKQEQCVARCALQVQCGDGQRCTLQGTTTKHLTGTIPIVEKPSATLKVPYKCNNSIITLARYAWHCVRQSCQILSKCKIKVGHISRERKQISK